ncbi:hypothetical protein OHS59_22970 [Streptomyces sp. NBC_00414]
MQTSSRIEERIGDVNGTLAGLRSGCHLVGSTAYSSQGGVCFT